MGYVVRFLEMIPCDPETATTQVASSRLHRFIPLPNDLVVVRSLSSLAATVLVDLSKSFSFSPRSFGPNRTQITLVFGWSLGLVKPGGEKAQLAFKNRPVSLGF